MYTTTMVRIRTLCGVCVLFVLAVSGTAFAQESSADAEAEAEGSAEVGIDALDPDDDGDGVPTGTAEGEGGAGASGSSERENGAQAEMQGETEAQTQTETEAEARAADEASTRTTKDLDRASPKLMEARAAGDGGVSLGAGVELGGRLCAQSGDCDDSDESVAPDGSEHGLTVRVSGTEVRGWDPEKKERIQAHLQSRSTITSANDFGIEAASAALADASIVEIVSTDSKSEVAFDTTVQFLGFIPMNVRAVARAEAGGTASVEYPWYGFLAAKGDTRTYTELAARIRSVHDEIAISVEEEGAPVNRRNDASE